MPGEPVTIYKEKCGPRFQLPNGLEIYAVWHRTCWGVAIMYGKDPEAGPIESAHAFNLDGSRPKPRAPIVCGTCGQQVKKYDLLADIPGRPNIDPRYFTAKLDQWQETARETIEADEIEHANLFKAGQVRPDTNIQVVLADRLKMYNGRSYSIPGAKPAAPFDLLRFTNEQRKRTSATGAASPGAARTNDRGSVTRR